MTEGRAVPGTAGQRTGSDSLRNSAGAGAPVFTPAQREAVTWGQGPLLVLAGPGSGKTFVITHRVRYLTEELKEEPGRILVVTFSRAAAEEMEERYRKLLADDAAPTGQPGVAGRVQCPDSGGREGPARRGRVTFGTFHSFFFGLLRTAYGYAADQVAGDEERTRIVYGLIREHRMESDDIRMLSRNLISEIALVKEERAELNHYYSVNCPAETFREIFRGYEKALGQLKKIDYEDMLLMTYELLRGRPDILAAVQKRWKWVLVDEFQDINRLQYEIIRMISAPENNLTIVGDDDQSIYRFRGAKPEIMLGFRKDYPGAARVLLDVNFRSTPEIVKTSARLIRKNKNRFDKEIRAAAPSGKPVDTVVFRDTSEEALWIAREIRRRVRGLVVKGKAAEAGSAGAGRGSEAAEAGSVKSGSAAKAGSVKTGGAAEAGHLRYSDFAILYRTNLQPRLLAARLMAENIPFTMREMLPDLMDHWIARDISAYLRLSRGTAEPGDLVRIMNRPNRYIRREALRRFGESVEGLRQYYAGSDQRWMRERIDGLQRELKLLSRMKVGDAIRYIRKDIGYDAFLKEYGEQHYIEPAELLEVLDEVQESAEGFMTPEEWFAHAKEFREELKRRSSGAPGNAGSAACAGRAENPGGSAAGAGGAAGHDRAEEDRVQLMTFHASKGLEFPVVFIIDVNEGVVPHRKAGSREEQEEERRMFYVAMTRAKEELHVCTCRQRFRREAEESPFIADYERR